ncbi:MAG: VacJ family lipoprotein [Alphaproteobacteria bacterium]|nr:VacJ family lipoprotein [Alphaproteobacteria bacterium]
MPYFGRNQSNRFLAPVLIVLALALSACTTAPRETGINDPYEAGNRKVHAFNKSLDKAILKPASGAYGAITRGPVSQGVSNFSSNMSLPGVMVNDLLQLNMTEFFGNSFRFVMNTTVGLGGIFDVATQNGLPEYGTDFGETLFVWGVPEGTYLELPVYSGRTQRETVGIAVDFVLNPMNYVLPGNFRTIGTASHILNSLGDRNRFSDIVESVLYESEDSYAQGRLLYLQSRRFQLYGGLNEDDLEDPYAE